MKLLAFVDKQLYLLPLIQMFEEIGYKFTVAKEAQKGIDLFNEIKPDLVIIDINETFKNELEIIKKLRLEIGSSVPILVMSNNTSNELIAEAFELGINDFVKKPISYFDLYERIKRINIFFST